MEIKKEIAEFYAKELIHSLGYANLYLMERVEGDPRRYLVQRTDCWWIFDNILSAVAFLQKD